MLQKTRHTAKWQKPKLKLKETTGHLKNAHDATVNAHSQKKVSQEDMSDVELSRSFKAGSSPSGCETANRLLKKGNDYPKWEG